MNFDEQELQTMIDLCTMQIIRLDDGISLLPHRAEEFKTRIHNLKTIQHKLEVKLLAKQ